MKRRRKLLITLGLIVVIFIVRETGIAGFDWYNSESTASANIGPAGNFVRYPFQSTTFKRVSEINAFPNSQPNTAVIQYMDGSRITPLAWLPFYKSGQSTVVVVFRPYFGGNASGPEFYGAFNIQMTIMGICSRHTYAEKVQQAAFDSMSSYVARNFQKQDAK